MRYLFYVVYGAQTQFSSYGGETGKMILANLVRYKINVKTTSPARATLAVIPMPKPIKATLSFEGIRYCCACVIFFLSIKKSEALIAYLLVLI
jgi:hypothetical protein